MKLSLKKQNSLSIKTVFVILLLSKSWQESSSFVTPLQQHSFTSTSSTSSLALSPNQLSIEDRLDQLEARLQSITEVSNYIEERIDSRGTTIVTQEGSSNSGSYLDGLKSQSPQRLSGLPFYANVRSKETPNPVSDAGAQGPSSSSQLNELNTISSPSPETKSASAPEGTRNEESILGLSIPKLSNWRQLSDGTIRGYISGSNKFRDGDAITTTPIHSIAIEGAVVKSVSGTRYYLDKKIRAMNINPEPNTNGAIMNSIPILSNWRVRQNGSVSGIISGSTKFDDGVRVSTSPLTSDAVGGTIVTSMSGSRYFLEELKEHIQT